MTPPPEPVLDRQTFHELHAMTGDASSDLVARFVHLFLAEAQGLVTEVERACTADDRASVERAAHALRGAAGFIGGRHLAGCADAVERAAAGAQHTALNRMTMLLSDALHELRPVLLAALDEAA